MAIWIVIGVPLALFLISLWLHLNGTYAEEERRFGNANAAPSPMPTRRIAAIALTAALLALTLQVWTLYQDHHATARAHAAAESQYAYAAYMKAADPSFDVDCLDFAPAGDAQAFFDAGRRIHGPRADQFHLDSNHNGTACELIGTAYGDTWEDAATGEGTGGLRRWWSDDKDCASFASKIQAVDLFQMLGGDRYDPFNLDADKDGDPCEAAP